MEQIGNSYIKAKEGDRVEFFMTDIISIREVIKIGTNQITEIVEFNLVDQAEVDQALNKITGIIIVEKILEVM